MYVTLKHPYLDLGIFIRSKDQFRQSPVGKRHRDGKKIMGNIVIKWFFNYASIYLLLSWLTSTDCIHIFQIWSVFGQTEIEYGNPVSFFRRTVESHRSNRFEIPHAHDQLITVYSLIYPLLLTFRLGATNSLAFALPYPTLSSPHPPSSAHHFLVSNRLFYSPPLAYFFYDLPKCRDQTQTALGMSFNLG